MAKRQLPFRCSVIKEAVKKLRGPELLQHVEPVGRPHVYGWGRVRCYLQPWWGRHQRVVQLACQGPCPMDVILAQDCGACLTCDSSGWCHSTPHHCCKTPRHVVQIPGSFLPVVSHVILTTPGLGGRCHPQTTLRHVTNGHMRSRFLQISPCGDLRGTRCNTGTLTALFCAPAKISLL